MRSPTVQSTSGYALDLGEGLTAALHPDGSLSLERDEGAADLSPAQVEGLAELLRLGGGLRSQARRRRARNSYSTHYGSEQV